MVEAEELGGAGAVAEEVVERRQRGAPRAGREVAGALGVLGRGVPAVAEAGDRHLLEPPAATSAASVAGSRR